jgi:hypothetical protein
VVIFFVLKHCKGCVFEFGTCVSFPCVALDLFFQGIHKHHYHTHSGTLELTQDSNRFRTLDHWARHTARFKYATKLSEEERKLAG